VTFFKTLISYTRLKKTMKNNGQEKLDGK